MILQDDPAESISTLIFYPIALPQLLLSTANLKPLPLTLPIQRSNHEWRVVLLYNMHTMTPNVCSAIFLYCLVFSPVALPRLHFTVAITVVQRAIITNNPPLLKLETNDREERYDTHLTVIRPVHFILPKKSSF